jgi:chromosome segregation ATPase
LLEISKAKEAQLENVNKEINQEKKQMQDNLSRFEQITRRNEDKIAKQKDRNDELETQITLLTQSEHRLKGAIDKIGREKEAKEREIKIQEDRRQEAEEEKDAAKSAVTALTREVEWLRKQTDLEKSDIMKLVRDRDMIKRTLAAVSDTNQKNRNEIIQKEQTIATTLEQNNKYKENIQ